MKRPNVLNLTCPAIPVVRIGFVGLGNRGILALERYMHLEGIEVKALCDLRKENIERAEHILREFGRPEAENYSEEGMWRKMCECKEIDLIYICTDWLTHTDIAVYALQQGRHVALEVPAAMSVADCWRLVDTAEETRRHCMMLENCCYDAFALTTLNMVQQGVLGEITHAEGSYIHDLRKHYLQTKSGWVSQSLDKALQPAAYGESLSYSRLGSCLPMDEYSSGRPYGISGFHVLASGRSVCLCRTGVWRILRRSGAEL